MYISHSHSPSRCSLGRDKARVKVCYLCHAHKWCMFGSVQHVAVFNFSRIQPHLYIQLQLNTATCWTNPNIHHLGHLSYRCQNVLWKNSFYLSDIGQHYMQQCRQQHIDSMWLYSTSVGRVVFDVCLFCCSSELLTSYVISVCLGLSTLVLRCRRWPT